MGDGELKPRVMVVDNEPIIADTLVMILNQNGFEARAAYSGEQAIEMALSVHPSVLITDVILSGVNGIDTGIQVRRLLPSIRILLMSGQTVAGELLERAQAQGHEFEILAKPVHPSELLAKL